MSLKINGIQIKHHLYPDRTVLLRFSCTDLTPPVVIDWRYEYPNELIVLQFLVAHLNEHGYDDIILHMPYIPYARHDRAPSDEDLLLLKHFASIVNGLNFTSVQVLDPHSYVSQNLFKHIRIEQPTHFVEKALKDIQQQETIPVTLFFPDEGAMKRYGSAYKQKYCFGIKKRDWETGEILGLDLAGHTESVAEHPILIIDDICSAGETFHYAAEKLKKVGAGNIYLWVTHCEETIYHGKLLMENSLIQHIYTTNSLVRPAHEKITEIPISEKFYF